MSPSGRSALCVASIALSSGCVSIDDVSPDPAQPGNLVRVEMSNIIGPSFLEPGADVKFDGQSMSLSPDTSDEAGFVVPAATTPGSHTVRATDVAGLLEILSVVLLLRRRTDVETLEIEAPPAVINMIPRTLSGETNQDSEPFLSAHPTNPSLLVGTAFTPNPGSTATRISTTAPIYVSRNAGRTWVLVNSVPSQAITGDITTGFDSDGKSRGNLHAGILRRPAAAGFPRTLDELNIADAISAGPMAVVNTNQSADQPFVTIARRAGTDRIYVPNNDMGSTPRTASIDLSTDGGATWSTLRIEQRNAFNQDAPSVRVSVARDGVAYAAFLSRTNAAGVNRTTDVVVVRDDGGGVGANPFQDLLDSGDGIAGQRVVQGVNIPFIDAPTLGQERIGSMLSLAVDPDLSSTIYLAWADRVGTGDIYTVHVRRSLDSGQNWSNDLRTITDATNAALAIADNGTVGLLYQQVTNPGAADSRWVTHLEQTRDEFQAIQDSVLATTPANTPALAFRPYLGDYTYLLVQGSAFRGVFSANNTPDLANFPLGVVYERSADFSTNTLNDGLRNNVAISIDPFFFSIQVMPRGDR